MPARSVQDYIETALEPLGDFAGSLGVAWGQYVSPGTPFSVGSFYNPVVEPPRSVPPPPIFPTVVVQPPEPTAYDGDSQTTGDEALPSYEVIDPLSGQSVTVFETEAPEGIYEVERAETDWDWVYDQWVILNAPQAPEDPAVLHGSIDWGQVVGTIVGGVADPFGVGRYAASAFQAPIPPVNPLVAPALAGAAPRVAIDPRTGRPVCKRRRRRRLLTDGDFNDLMRISTLPNKDIVKIALAKAVGR